VPAITDNLVPFGHTVTSTQRTIDTVVLYSSFNATGDAYDFSQMIQTYKASNVSPHYFIDRQGNIYRVVADKDIAYHAGKGKMPDGRTGINNFSLGIVMIYKDTEGPNDQQYLALNGLLQILEGEYNIGNIVTHGQISTSGKTDPWNFDMTKLVSPQEVVILGELKKGLVWTATKGILEKAGGNWALKSSEEMNIKTVWQ
jgi:N-acetyl-anhydromuramyl-L-alanine amidase AmpD